MASPKNILNSVSKREAKVKVFDNIDDLVLSALIMVRMVYSLLGLLVAHRRLRRRIRRPFHGSFV